MQHLSSGRRLSTLTAEQGVSRGLTCGGRGLEVEVVEGVMGSGSGGGVENLPPPGLLTYSCSLKNGDGRV